MAEPNHHEESHQARIDFVSDIIREIAFKEQQTTTIFQIGDEVEVASQELGYIGSYYNATILYSFGPDGYVVKYKTLVTDDESAPLEEHVKVSEVRPVPPDFSHEIMPMEIYDMVDVYDNEGWWFGVITGKTRESYYVHFPTTAENLVYSVQKLRFHQEFTNGEWIFPSG